VASGRGCGAPTLRSLGSSRGISLVRSSLYFIHRSWWERRCPKHVCRIANRSAPRRGTKAPLIEIGPVHGNRSGRKSLGCL
jgi:hypothetical protein